jgi:rod shape determining protein RodA
LLINLDVIAEKQHSDFSRYYIYGVTGIIFMHFFINIGMTLALVPVIGIPLPLVSYGGSSMMAFTLMIFTVLKLDMNRSAVL